MGGGVFRGIGDPLKKYPLKEFSLWLIQSYERRKREIKIANFVETMDLTQNNTNRNKCFYFLQGKRIMYMDWKLFFCYSCVRQKLTKKGVACSCCLKNSSRQLFWRLSCQAVKFLYYLIIYFIKPKLLEPAVVVVTHL